MKKVLLRDVTLDECPWLDENLPKGLAVYVYGGATYGCISPDGIAITKVQDKTPFFQIPIDSI